MLNLRQRPKSGRWHCLKPGKRSSLAVDEAQQTSPRADDNSQRREFLRCSECGYPITRNVDRTNVNEQHQHVFANPHGYVYQIGCFSQAPGCIIIGEETSHFSWFPGYSWRIALCGRCLALLGWAFRKRESQFFGLILEKLKHGS